MKNKKTFHQVKKEALRLFILGSLLMGIPLLTRHVFQLPEDAGDFIKGLGVAFIVGSLYVQKNWKEKRCRSCNQK